MRRIDSESKKQIDNNGKKFSGFSAGDQESRTEATHLTDSWCNNIQEEICSVIEGFGHTVNSEINEEEKNKGKSGRVEKYDQMFKAIKMMHESSTPIGTIRAMGKEVPDEFLAYWVLCDQDEEGAVYFPSPGMASTNSFKKFNQAGWYKLTVGLEENNPSGAMGWMLANGIYTLPLSFGDRGTWKEATGGIFDEWMGKAPIDTPNLDSDTFLMGTFGELTLRVEGHNTRTLSASQLPSHSHTINHTHTATCNYNGSHYHHYYDASNHSGFYSGTDGHAHGRGYDAILSTDSAGNHNHTITVNKHYGLSGNTGGGSAIDIRPKRLGVKYYMRVI